MEAQEQLYYDESCPMCNWYSKQFVNAEILEGSGRCKFNTAQDLLESGKIDPDRARNEIPLYFPKEGTTKYGLDALLYLIGKRSNILEKIGRWKPIYWFFSKLYKLVSYNRRIIVAHSTEEETDPAEPSFNTKYRWIFIVFCALVSIGITGSAAQLFGSYSNTVFWSIAGGWIIYFLGTRPSLDYRQWFELLSHTSVTMLRGVLIFGIGIFFCRIYLPYGAVFGIVFTTLSFLDMNFQMLKRSKLLNISIGYYVFWLVALTGWMFSLLCSSINIDLW